MAIDLQHRDRRCALNTRPAPTHNQEDVRCTCRHARRDHPARERVDQSEETPGNLVAEVRPGARWTITCHRLPLPSSLAAPQGSSCSAYVEWPDRAATDDRRLTPRRGRGRGDLASAYWRE